MGDKLVKTIFGIGPIKIRRIMNDGSVSEAEFNYYLKEDIDILLDIKNSGKKAHSGKDLSYIDGDKLEFILVLTEPANRDNSGEGDNIIKLLDMISDYIQADKDSQNLQIIPADSAQSNIVYSCKIVGDRIKIRDIKIRGYGQSIELKLRTISRFTSIPYSYYMDVDKTGNIGNELIDIY